MKISDILSKYDLYFKNVENDVYEVLNTDNVIDIDSLGSELGHCILVVSNTIEKKKDDNTQTYHKFAKIYYVVTDLNKAKWGDYKKLALERYDIVFARSYDVNKIDSLGTLRYLQ